MNADTRTTRTISETSYYVTLAGAINPNSDNGGVGPSIMTISITQTTDEATGQEFAPSYAISFDGKYQCGGFAAHLPSDPATASFLSGMAIVHGEIVPVEAPVAKPSPMTYSAAAKVVETISLDEFKALLESARRSVTIFSKPRARRRHCWNVRLVNEARTELRWLYVCGECCAPVAGTNDFLNANLRSAIFDFYTLGRIVRVDVSETTPAPAPVASEVATIRPSEHPVFAAFSSVVTDRLDAQWEAEQAVAPVASEEVVAAAPENVLAILDEAISNEATEEPLRCLLNHSRSSGCDGVASYWLRAASWPVEFPHLPACASVVESVRRLGTWDIVSFDAMKWAGFGPDAPKCERCGRQGEVVMIDLSENVCRTCLEAIPETIEMWDVPFVSETVLTVKLVGKGDHRENVRQALKELEASLADESLMDGSTEFVVTSFVGLAGGFAAVEAGYHDNGQPFIPALLFRIESHDGSGTFSEDFAVVGDDIVSSEDGFKVVGR